MVAELLVIAVAFKPVGTPEQAIGVQIYVNPEVGNAAVTVLVNLRLCALFVAAAVSFQAGELSGTEVVNLLALKSVFILPLSPT